jgi:hypothetical protein
MLVLLSTLKGIAATTTRKLTLISRSSVHSESCIHTPYDCDAIVTVEDIWRKSKGNLGKEEGRGRERREERDLYIDKKLGDNRRQENKGAIE